MKVINKSRKVIGINNEPLLPGDSLELAVGQEKHPMIAYYLEKGVLVDAASASANGNGFTGVSDAERKAIEQAAIEEYKKQQEKEAEIKAVGEMKKADLLKKAAGMGLEVKETDSLDELKEAIIKALNE